MKRHLINSVLLWLAMLVPAIAQNFCSDQVIYGNWQCIQAGSVNNIGVLEYTNLSVCAGETINPPDASATSFFSGKKRRYVSHTCPEFYALNHWETNDVSYANGQVYFDPPIPNSFSESILRPLSNGSFEAGFTDWTTSGSEIIISPYVEASDGANCVELGANDLPGAFLFQDFPVVAGATYVLTFDVLALGDTGRTGIVSAEISCVVGTLVSESIIKPASNSAPFVYDKKSILFTIPPDVTEARLTFSDLSPSDGEAVDPIIDNVRVVANSPITNQFVAKVDGIADGGICSDITGIELGVITITVIKPVIPIIVRNPTNVQADEGENAMFSVEASGCSLHYQWRKNGEILVDEGPPLSGAHISGATSPDLIITGVTQEDIGIYTVDISNSAGITKSTSATLTVCHDSMNYHDVVLPGKMVQMWNPYDLGIASFTFPEPKIIVGYKVDAISPSYWFDGSETIYGEMWRLPYKCQVMTCSDYDPAWRIADQALEWNIGRIDPEVWPGRYFNGWNPYYRGLEAVNYINNQRDILTATSSAAYSFWLRSPSIKFYSIPWMVQIRPIERIFSSGMICDGPPQLPSVEFDPPGSATLPPPVTLSVPGHPNAAIYYTLDGSDPTPSSILYDGPITISSSSGVLIKAFATETAVADAPTSSAAFGGGAPVPSGLVAWWPGDGTMEDRTGKHNGAYAISRPSSSFGSKVVPPVFGAGIVGSAFQIPRPIYVMDDSALAFTESFTVEGWIRPGSKWGKIFCRADDQSVAYSVGTVPTQVPGRALIRFDIAGGTAVVEAPVEMRGWTHFAAVFDRSDPTAFKLKLYINGNLAAEQTTTSSPSVTLNANSAVMIGSGFDGNQAFGGMIDELSVYSRPLSDWEIYNISLAGDQGKIPSSKTALAPNITTFVPSSQTVNSGYPAAFSAVSEGVDLTYKWYRNTGSGYVYLGDTRTMGINRSPFFVIGRTALSDAGTYMVTVENSLGSISSAEVTLNVNTTPTLSIVAQPKSQIVTEGDAVTLSVDAMGTWPITYQWRHNGTDISGATSLSYIIDPTTTSDAGNYQVVVANAAGSEVSLTAALTITPPVAPVIVEQPASQAVPFGATATFSVGVTGSPIAGPPSHFDYQWFRNGQIIPGATERSYTTSSAELGNDGDTYHVVVTGRVGPNATSEEAILYVTDDPVIVLQPQTATKNIGESHSLTVGVKSASPLTYQWRRDGKDLEDAMDAVLTFRYLELFDSGTYSVVVKNAHGEAASANAILTVTDPDPDCPNPPCPPQLTHINELKLPSARGTYAFSIRDLLPPNSDAKYVTKFTVNRVLSGSLMINGKAFSSQNCTIDRTAAAVWTPPANVIFPNTPPSFDVLAWNDSGCTTVAVPVHIGVKPKTRLYGWGALSYGTIGDGSYETDRGTTREFDHRHIWPGNLESQADMGVIPKDPRWKPIYGIDLYEITPQCVLDLPDIVSVSSLTALGRSSAVDKDGTLWQWGYGRNFRFGLPFANYRLQGDYQSPMQIWRWGAALPDLTVFDLYDPFSFGSPSPRRYTAPKSDMSQEPFTNVKSIQSYWADFVGGQMDGEIALKFDGTLWSWGAVGLLGRNPSKGDDRYDDSFGSSWGMAPRRIEIEGNTISEITPERKFEEIAGGYIARCKDGSVWWWGHMFDSYAINLGQKGWDFQRFEIDLANAAAINEFEPRRLSALDDPSNKVIQLAASRNHIIALRENSDRVTRSIVEIGYIPKLDAINIGRSAHPTFAQVTACYSALPVELDLNELHSRVSSVAAGPDFGVALTENGNVWVWGYIEPDIGPELRPLALEGITKVAAGPDYLLALDKLGRIWGWGYSHSGVLGLQPKFEGGLLKSRGLQDYVFHQPTLLALENVTDIFAGDRNAFAVGTELDKNRIKVTGMPMDGAAKLAWTTVPSATEYVIYRSLNRYENFEKVTVSTVNDYIDPDLHNQTTYYYSVAALVNGVETGRSWEEAVTPLPAPTAVLSLAATGQCRGVKLTWSEPSNAGDSHPTEYRIKRSETIGGDFAWIGSVRSDARSYFDNSVLPGVSYYYKVIPVNAAGEPAVTAVGPSEINDAPGGAVLAVHSYTAGINYSIGDEVTVPGGDNNCVLKITGLDSNGGATTFVILEPGTGYEVDSTGEALCIGGSGYGQYVAIDEVSSASCAAAPIIASTWKEHHWFKISLKENDEQSGYQAKLCWTAPTGTDEWESTPVGFRVRYWYTRNGKRSSVQVMDVPVSDTTPMQTDNGDVECWSGTWGAIEGVRWYASVCAIMDADGQESKSSIEVGPLIGVPPLADFSPRAVGGYKQVYLDWPDSEATCSYNVKASSLQPGATPELRDDIGPDDWVMLATGLTDPRFWHQDLQPTSFSPVDIKSVSGMVGKLTENPRDSISEIIWGDLQSKGVTLTDLSGNFSTVRNLLAAKLTDIIDDGGLLFDPYAQGMDEDDLSAETEQLLGQSNLTPDEITRLNRLLLEDAYPGQIARFRDPKYYVVEATPCDGSTTIWSRWIAASPDLNATQPPEIEFLAEAANYNGMVNVQWSFKKSFNAFVVDSSLALGCENVIVVSATRRSALGAVIETGVMGVDYTLDSPAGTLKIPTGSNLILSPGEQLVVKFAPWQSNSKWQFVLERKENPGGEYVMLTEAGFGLTYLDKDVVNGQTYYYRANAFDDKFNLYRAEVSATPSASGAFELLDAVAGNGYVDLTWTRTRASSYRVKHALSSNGPFDVIETLFTPNAFDDPPTIFRHSNVQNGVTHFYKIVAVTPEGSTELESNVKSAVPSATLPPLPPSDFKGAPIRVAKTGEPVHRQFLLTWKAQTGAATYQVFIRKNGVLTPIHTGPGLRYVYELPVDFQPVDGEKIPFSFAIRSVNEAGLVGELYEKSDIIWAEDADDGVIDSLVLKLMVGSEFVEEGHVIPITAPTNLVLSVDVSFPNIKRVSFYDGNELLGVSENGRKDFTWFHVPVGDHGGDHTLWAKVEAEVGDFDPNTGATKAFITAGADGPNVHVTIQPELRAFQTAVTDLGLPAPGMGISLSRSYTSRSTSKQAGDIAIGWMASWMAPSVRLSHDLQSGWEGATTMFLGQVTYYLFGESDSHLMTVSLPSGQEAYFQPTISTAPTTEPKFYGPEGYGVEMRLDAFNPEFGSLVGISDVSITEPDVLTILDSEDWNGIPIEFDVTAGPFTYTASDNTEYIFGQETDGGSRWLLTQIKDPNGNKLIYTYKSSGLDIGKLESISHNSGRKVVFDYTTAHEIHVFDNISIGTSYPTLKYVLNLTDNQLLAVSNLVNRVSGIYEVTSYKYGTSGGDHDRLTEMYDSRNVRILLNKYADDNLNTDIDEANGDLLSQTDAAGHKTKFSFDEMTGELTLERRNADDSDTLQSVQINHDNSGSISGAMQPQDPDDVNDPLPATSLTYNERGRVLSEKDASGKITTYQYDNKDRLVGKQDPNGIGTVMELNDAGQPTITEDAKGKQTIYLYDPQGNPLSIADPSGTKTEYTYLDEQNEVDYSLAKRTRSERRDAPFVPFTIVNEYSYYGDDPGDAGAPSKGDIKSTTLKQVQIKDNGTDRVVGTPITTYFEYDADGNRTAEIKSRTKSDGSIESVEFIRTEFTYDAKARVTDSEIKTGPDLTGPWTSVPQTKTHTEYNNFGKQSKTVDGYGRTTEFVYNVLGNLIETIYPSSPDVPLTVSRTSYDDFGRPEFVQDRAVPVITGSAGSEKWTTTAPATQTTYDASGRVVKVEKFESVTMVRSRAVAGADFYGDGYNPSTDPQFKMEATPSGTAITTTRTFYDNVGRVKFSVDARNLVTKYGYDDGGRRTSVTVYPKYNYSGTGEPDPEQSADFQQTRYFYDANGNQTMVISAIASLDVNGNPVGGQTNIFEYDDANRNIRTTFPPTADNVKYSRMTSYDGLGQRIEETDEAGITTRYSYDFRGLLSSVTLAFGTDKPAITIYDYDELGNQTNQVDAEGRATRFDYDALGRRTHRFLPGAESFDETVSGSHNQSLEKTSYHQDQIGTSGVFVHRKEITDFRGYTTTNLYDILDRLVTKAPDNALPPAERTTVKFEYTATGQRSRVTQTGGTQRTARYVYDTLGRLRVKDTPEGALTYAYDPIGAVTQISAQNAYEGWPNDPPYTLPLNVAGTSADRAQWNYRYDRLGRIYQVNPDNEEDEYPPADVTYTFDAVGNLQSTTNRNGLVTTYSYNSRNWLRMMETELGGTVKARFDYDGAAVGANWDAERKLSPTGQRRGMNELVNEASRTVGYEYDLMRRLTKETIGSGSSGPVGEVGYSSTDPLEGYDLVGNRRTRTVSTTALQNAGVSVVSGDTFDERDRLNANNGCTYNANGNMTADAVATYEYDSENRLIKFTPGAGASVYYGYDAEGNRVSKTIGSTTTSYLVDDRNPTGYAQVVEEFQGDPDFPTVVYAYGLDLISQKRNTGTGQTPVWETSYYGYDGLGSVRYLSGSTGNVTDTYTYDAFGVEIASSGNTQNSYRFTGEQRDAETGMCYNRARYYKPESGRFLTSDSFEGRKADPLSLHKYLYAANNSVNIVDPSGHDGNTISTTAAIGIALNIAFAATDAVQAAKRRAIGDYRGAAEYDAWFTIDILLLAVPYSGMTGTVGRGGVRAIETYLRAATGITAKLGGANAAAHIVTMFAKARANGGADSGDSLKSDPSTGRQDGSHSNVDSAREAAWKNAGDLGENTSKMYDPETGTLIGEMSGDGKRGWRLDEGHFNWWDWSGGKKGTGGKYGHEFFSGETGPHSKYIDYAPWQ